MRISLNWLQELVDITTSAEALAELLTMAGFEVEDIEDRRTWAKGVVVGRVLSRQQHPNADKLSVCEVDIGAQKPAQIVCGAANVGADQYVPVATLGTYLPRIDLKIKPAKLRGVASEGMICSLTELGLTKESEGIHILGRVPESTLVPGTDVRPLLGLDDVILDVTSTANRADVLSMVGLAREVAAITGSPLKLPGVDAHPLAVGQQQLQLQVQESQACPRYIGTILENIEIQPSPDWLQRRLQSAGIRPINNVVDITNLVLLEWGQPLHAFDRDRVLSLTPAKDLDDLSIGVRYAEPQETLQTLDGQSRSLQPQNLVIVAGQHPIAVAGVMGGEDTEVTAQTQRLILEAAVFDAAVIRRSARAQGLRTEASIRYERGVNSAELDLACNRALQLLQELAGATIVGQSSTALPKQWSTTRSIALKLERVRQVLGPVLPPESQPRSDAALSEVELSEVSVETVERTLSALGCTLKTKGNEEWQVTVPPYRYRDLEREIDLIEEIARLYGYNNFADTLPAKTEPGYLALDELLLRKIRGYLRGAGLTELVHYSVVKPDHSDRQVVIVNPLFAEYSALRTDLVSGLIEACHLNVEQGNGCLNGFELGRIFGKDEGGLQESDSLAGILGGERVQGAWVRGGQPQPLTWYEAKGILDGFFEHLGVRVEYQPDRRDPRLHPGRTASLWFQGDRLGIFGQLHPQLRQERDLPEAVYVFEISLEVLLNSLDQDERLIPLFKPFSTYPPSDRDIAFFAPVTTAVADLQRAMNKAGGSLLESIELFDEYRGEHVPTGQRSLAFRLVYRASDRTLTDSDIDPVHQKVRDVLQEQFGVTLRS